MTVFPDTAVRETQASSCECTGADTRQQWAYR